MEDQLLLGILWYVVFVVSATFHEAAHAFIAYKLGDLTAFHGGQVTLNPVPHIKREPFGMVVIPWLSFAASGWMIGWASSPYDPEWARTYPRRSAAMALSGPASNLLLTIAAGIIIKIGLFTGFFLPPDPERFGFSHLASGGSACIDISATVISILFSLNLVLCVFNLIPITPLDGQAWMELLLKGDLLLKYRMLMRHPSLRIFGILIAWLIMDYIFGPIFRFALILLYLF